ncbi:MAG TPA: hypothetical protein VMW69_07605 [Spirochaetia bacterium]|nr:hypothetical protein [Spirochaetia bacterium]
MQYRPSSSLRFHFLLLVVLILTTGSVFGQQNGPNPKPLIILTSLSSPAGDTVAEKLAATVTTSIDLMMRLTGSLIVHQVDYLSPTTAFDRAVKYYQDVKADGAVFGSVSAAGVGGYTIGLSIWNAAASDGEPAVLRRTISDLRASFDLADELSLNVASTIIGRRLAEGTLMVQGDSSLPQFSVYANGHLLGRDRTEFRLLTGNWTIVVAKPGQLGDEPVQTFAVEIRNGRTSTVALSEVAPKSAAPTKLPTPVPPTHEGSPQPKVGKLSIRTNDAGTLYIDGKLKSQRPENSMIEIDNLSAGDHTVEVVFNSGNPEIRTVTVLANENAEVSFSDLAFTVAPILTGWSPVSGNGFNFQNRVTSHSVGSVLDLVKQLQNYPNLPRELRNQVDDFAVQMNRDSGILAGGLTVTLAGALALGVGGIWSNSYSVAPSGSTVLAIAGGVTSLLGLVVEGIGGTAFWGAWDRLMAFWNQHTKIARETSGK